MQNKKKSSPLVPFSLSTTTLQLFNNISGLQACVEPDLVSGMLVPQDKALKNSKRVHAEIEFVYPPGFETVPNQLSNSKPETHQLNATSWSLRQARSTPSQAKFHGGLVVPHANDFG